MAILYRSRGTHSGRLHGLPLRLQNRVRRRFLAFGKAQPRPPQPPRLLLFGRSVADDFLSRHRASKPGTRAGLRERPPNAPPWPRVAPAELVALLNFAVKIA